MSILNVNTIQPVSAGTTVTVSSGDLIVGTDIRFGSSSGVCTATKFDGDASSLTSIPGARITGTIPVGALTNATVDLTGIRKDIATLALQVAVDTNRASVKLYAALLVSTAVCNANVAISFLSPLKSILLNDAWGIIPVILAPGMSVNFSPDP